jgi:HAD superfamily hydrolase (TIGR01549 family)
LHSKGVRPSKEEWRRQILQQMREMSSKAQEISGRFVESDFLVESLVRHYLPQKAEEAVQLRRGMTRIVIAEEVFDLLEALGDRGYPLGILSNEGVELIEALRINRLLDYFQFVLTADDVVHPKPNIKIFEMAMEEFGAQPNEMIMVGDRFALDVEPALGAGWQAILYDPTGFEREAYRHHESKKEAAETSESKVISMGNRRATKSFHGARVIERLAELSEILK